MAVSGSLQKGLSQSSQPFGRGMLCSLKHCQPGHAYQPARFVRYLTGNRGF